MTWWPALRPVVRAIVVAIVGFNVRCQDTLCTWVQVLPSSLEVALPLAASGLELVPCKLLSGDLGGSTLTTSWLCNFREKNVPFATVPIKPSIGSHAYL